MENIAQAISQVAQLQIPKMPRKIPCTSNNMRTLFIYGQSTNSMETINEGPVDDEVNYGEQCFSGTEMVNRSAKMRGTEEQKYLYNQVVKDLRELQLAYVTLSGQPDEEAQRLVALEVATGKMRTTLNNIVSDYRKVIWFNEALKEIMPTSLLAFYLEILKNLKGKVPMFAEEMDFMPPNCPGGSKSEVLLSNLYKTWNPNAPSLSEDNLMKRPTFLLVQSGVGCHISNNLSRTDSWAAMLSLIGKVLKIEVNGSQRTTHFSVSSSKETLDEVISSINGKINEVYESSPGQPIYLVGWNFGGTIACSVALKEDKVTGIICLNYPTKVSTDQEANNIATSIFLVSCPILFVCGQDSSLWPNEDNFKIFQDYLSTRSTLLLVGSADDQLRVSEEKKVSEGRTQFVMDSFLMEEVAEFLNDVVTEPSDTIKGIFLNKYPAGETNLPPPVDITKLKRFPTIDEVFMYLASYPMRAGYCEEGANQHAHEPDHDGDDDAASSFMQNFQPIPEDLFSFMADNHSSEGTENKPTSPSTVSSKRGINTKGEEAKEVQQKMPKKDSRCIQKGMVPFDGLPDTLKQDPF